MSIALPDGPRGRLLAIAITSCAAAMLWFSALAPLLDWYNNRAELLQQRTTLARRMEAVAETVPSLKEQVAATASGAPAAAPPESAVLGGTSDALAAAALQTRLSELASGAGVTLASVETLAAADAGAFRRIPLRLSLSAQWPVLVQFLAAVEQASPRMVVDDILFRGAAAFGRVSGLAGQEPVQATMTVAAFRAADAARPGRS